MTGKITRFFGKIGQGPAAPLEKRKQDVIVIDSDAKEQEQVAKRVRTEPEQAQASEPGSQESQEVVHCQVHISQQHPPNPSCTVAGSAELTPAAKLHPSAATKSSSPALAVEQPALDSASAGAPACQATAAASPDRNSQDEACMPVSVPKAPQGAEQSQPAHAPPCTAAAPAHATTAPAAFKSASAPAAGTDHVAAAQAVLHGDRQQLLQDLTVELSQVTAFLGRECLLPSRFNRSSPSDGVAAAEAPAAAGAAVGAGAVAADGRDGSSVVGFQDQASSSGSLSLLATAEVAAFLEGQVRPLSQLLPMLMSSLGLPEAKASDLVRDLAARKSYAAKEGPSVTGWHVTADDTCPTALWVWELLELKKALAPLKQPALRRQAEAQRKKRKDLHSRMVALTDAVELLTKGGTTKAAEAKLLKSMTKLCKLPTLQQVEAQPQEAAPGVGGKAGAGAAASLTSPEARAPVIKAAGEVAEAPGQLTPGDTPEPGTKEGAGKACRDTLDKAGKEAERVAKEAEKAAREAAKAEERAAKEAQKEAERAAKEAQKEAERAAKEATKEAQKEAKKAAKTGFGGKKALNHAASIMQRFISITPSKGQGDSPEATGDTPGQRPPNSPSRRQRQPTFPSGMHPSLDPARVDQLRAELDASLARRLSSAELQQCIQQLQGVGGRLMSRQPPRRLLGVPPTWARRPNCSLDPAEHVTRHYGEGADCLRVKAWRRKLLSFHQCNRPAYYGSFSQKSKVVGPRHPLARDTLLLDYDNDSDEDWEEEPEGEDLGDDAMEEDEPEAAVEAEEEQGDGFMVDDGYLSEDEGVRDSQRGEGEPEEGTKGASEQVQSRPPGGSRSHVDPRLQQLQGAIDRAARSNRCLVLVRDPAIGCEQSSGLDPQVLDALRPIFLRPGPPAKPVPQEWGLYAYLQPVQRPDAKGTAAGTAGGTDGGGRADVLSPGAGCAAAGAQGAGQGGPRGRGRPSIPFPEALLPTLCTFVLANGSLKVDQLVEAFITAHPGHVLRKKAVKEAVKAQAAYDHKAGAWRLRAGAPTSPHSAPVGGRGTPAGGSGAGVAQGSGAADHVACAEGLAARAAFSPAAGTGAGAAAGPSTAPALSPAGTAGAGQLHAVAQAVAPEAGLGTTQGGADAQAQSLARAGAGSGSGPASGPASGAGVGLARAGSVGSKPSAQKPKAGKSLEHFFQKSAAAKTPTQPPTVGAAAPTANANQQNRQGQEERQMESKPASALSPTPQPSPAAGHSTPPPAPGAAGSNTPVTPTTSSCFPTVEVAALAAAGRLRPPTNTPEGPHAGPMQTPHARPEARGGSGGLTPLLAAVASRAAAVASADSGAGHATTPLCLGHSPAAGASLSVERGPAVSETPSQQPQVSFPAEARECMLFSSSRATALQPGEKRERDWEGTKDSQGGAQKGEVLAFGSPCPAEKPVGGRAKGLSNEGGALAFGSPCVEEGRPAKRAALSEVADA